MMMPSYTTLPESMLSPNQIYEKFNVPTMGGLGCGCSIILDDGSCEDPESCDSSGTSSSVSDCAYGGTYPNCNPAPSSAGTVISSGGSTSTGTNSSGLTAAQQAALDATILKGGLSLAQQLALQPGQSLVGTNVVSGGVSGASLGLSSATSNVMPLVIIALGAAVLFGMRGK
jgi:hypothetical protein